MKQAITLMYFGFTVYAGIRFGHELPWYWWAVLIALWIHAAVSFTVGFVSGFRKAQKEKQNEIEAHDEPTIRINVQ